MDIETRCNGLDGFAEFGFGEDWMLMFAYDLRGWRIGFSWKRIPHFESYSLNVLCFDVHLHR